jgi:hypothetical protein
MTRFCNDNGLAAVHALGRSVKSIVLPILFAAVLPAADSPMTPALNSFTTDCYKQLAGGDGNLILSPFNIDTALSMALAGARGQSAEEIESVVHVQYDSAYDPAVGSLPPASPRPATQKATNSTRRTDSGCKRDLAFSRPSKTLSPTATTPRSRCSISSRTQRPLESGSTAGPNGIPTTRS